MNRGIMKVAVTALAMGLTMGLTACGGGGGGGGNTGTVLSSSTDVTAGLVALTKSVAESSASRQVFDLSLGKTPASPAGTLAMSTDLTFDSTWMTFDSFVPDAAQTGTVVAAVDQSDPNRLVLAVTDMQSGALGKLSFITTGASHSTLVDFKSTSYIDASGQAMPTIPLTGTGGTASN